MADEWANHIWFGKQYFCRTFLFSVVNEVRLGVRCFQLFRFNQGVNDIFSAKILKRYIQQNLCFNKNVNNVKKLLIKTTFLCNIVWHV